MFDAVAAEFPEAHAIPLSALNGDNVTERSHEHALLRRPAAAGAARGARARARPRRRRLPLPRPVGRPPDVRRAPRLPRLRGAGGRRDGAARATRWSCCPVARARAWRRSTRLDGELDEAFYPLSVTLRLEGEHDVSRGSLIAAADAAPEPVRELEAEVCWMARGAADARRAAAGQAPQPDRRGEGGLDRRPPRRQQRRARPGRRAGAERHRPRPPAPGARRSWPTPTRTTAPPAASSSSTTPATTPSAPEWWSSERRQPDPAPARGAQASASRVRLRPGRSAWPT